MERIAERPTVNDAATQRRHFGFRLRLVDKLQPIGGGSGRGRPLRGTRETWMAPNFISGDPHAHGADVADTLGRRSGKTLGRFALGTPLR